MVSACMCLAAVGARGCAALLTADSEPIGWGGA
jgi:hypothetical protein